MAYRFKPARPLDQEFRRIGGELIGLARRRLAEPDDRHEGVHEARRAFKKLRGLLRMARPALGNAYRSENARWRDASRQLSSLRDATALIETFDALQARYAPVLKTRALAGIGDTLVARRDDLAARQARLETRIAAVLDELDRGEAALGAMPLPSDDPAAFAAGLARVYGQALKQYRKARRRMTDDGLHDWRKRSKYHWMHLQLLRDVWPVPVRFRMKGAKALSDMLGDDHDLVVLRNLITAAPDGFGGEAERSLLLALIGQRQAELRHDAVARGARLFTREPEWFAARVELVWRAAIESARAGSEPATASTARAAAAQGARAG